MKIEEYMRDLIFALGFALIGFLIATLVSPIHDDLSECSSALSECEFGSNIRLENIISLQTIFDEYSYCFESDSPSHGREVARVDYLDENFRWNGNLIVGDTRTFCNKMVNYYDLKTYCFDYCVGIDSIDCNSASYPCSFSCECFVDEPCASDFVGEKK